MFDEPHLFAGHVPVSLLVDDFNEGVFSGSKSETTASDLFLAVSEEFESLHDGDDVAIVLESNSRKIFVCFLLLRSNVEVEGHWHEVAHSAFVSVGLHLHHLEHLHLVHDSIEGEGPALTDGL